MVCAPKNYFGHEHHLFQERLLWLLHSLASGVLLVDWTCLLALHYYCFCTPVFDCRGYQARSCSSTLRSALQEITSSTSITRSMSDCYCFYVLSPTAPCWQTGLSLAPLHLILVPSVCCRLRRKRNSPALSFTRTLLALPHEQPSSARSSCRVLYATSFLTLVNSSHACLGGVLHCFDGVFML
nr:uncharacterized protein LOC129383269 [Dermacentor andersoni]